MGGLGSKGRDTSTEDMTGRVEQMSILKIPNSGST